MNADQILVRLKSQADPIAVEGMARYGINPNNTLGVSIPTLRVMAREIGKDHQLAEEFAGHADFCIEKIDQILEIIADKKG